MGAGMEPATSERCPAGSIAVVGRPPRLQVAMSIAVPGLAMGPAAIPHAELTDLSVEEASAKQCESHGELGAVAEQHVIAAERVVRGVLDGPRRVEAPVEALDPGSAGGRHRSAHELLEREREHHVQLGPVLEQRLGPENVGARGQRPVGVSNGRPLELRGDGGGQRRLGLGAEARPLARCADPVATEVHHCGARRAGQARQGRSRSPGRRAAAGGVS